MRRYVVPVVVLLVAFAGAVTYKRTVEHSESPTAEPATPRTDALDEDARARALARNAPASGQAEDGAREPVVAQAPPWAPDAQPVDPSGPRMSPEPPEGYAFTSYFGEMEQLPLDPAATLHPPPGSSRSMRARSIPGFRTRTPSQGWCSRRGRPGGTGPSAI